MLTEETTLTGGEASLPPSIVEGIQSRYRRQVKNENEETDGGLGNQNGTSPYREKRAANRKKSHRQNSATNSTSDSAEASGSHENGISHGNSSRGVHRRGKREAAGTVNYSICWVRRTLNSTVLA